MLAPGTVIGRYRITAQIGSGGMGEVYRARDTNLNRNVAIKLILSDLSHDPSRVQRFHDEARAAGALNHPNVLAIHDFGTHEGVPYLVTELLEGHTLDQLLKFGRLPVKKAIGYAAGIAQGIAAAHAKGIVHRDLKPGNVFITRDEHVKVLDFGLAKLVQPETPGPDTAMATLSLVESGALPGTIGYMSPEQVHGEQVDHRSDIFALGCILYEMLTGRRAFRKASAVETLAAIVTEDVPPLSESECTVPHGVESILRLCLEKRPESRFQSAKDLALALAIFAGNEPISLPPGTVPPGALTTGTPPGGALPGGAGSAGTAWGRKRMALAFGGIVVAIAAAVTLTLLFTTRAQRPLDPSQVTFRRLTAERGHVYNARFSPDGKTIFYSASWDGRPVQLYETQPGLQVSRPLGLPPMNLLSVSPDRTLAVTLGDEWCILHPTHPATLATVSVTGGAPRALMDSVLSACWTPDGKLGAIAHLTRGKSHIEMPQGKHVYECDGDVRFLRLDGSGNMAAFLESPSHRMDGTVVILDAAGKVLTRSAQQVQVTGIAWSADGKEARFCTVTSAAASEIIGLAPDGRQHVVASLPGIVMLHDIGPDGRMLLGTEEVSAGNRGRSAPDGEERELGYLDWAPLSDLSADGRTILFHGELTGGGPAGRSVYTRGMDGSPPMRLGQGVSGTLSPDGLWALSFRYVPDEQIWLLPTGAGGKARHLPRGPIVEYHFSYMPRWMPDGRSIVVNGREQDGSMRSYLQDIEGGLPRAITPPGYVTQLVSPDGTFVIAGEPGGMTYICPLDGGTRVPLITLEFNERLTRFGADGQGVYVFTLGRRMDVDRVDLRSGRREPWRSFSLPDPAGSMMMGISMTADLRSYAYCYSRAMDVLYLAEGFE